MLGTPVWPALHRAPPLCACPFLHAPDALLACACLLVARSWAVEAAFEVPQKVEQACIARPAPARSARAKVKGGWQSEEDARLTRCVAQQDAADGETAVGTPESCVAVSDRREVDRRLGLCALTRATVFSQTAARETGPMWLVLWVGALASRCVVRPETGFAGLIVPLQISPISCRCSNSA